MPHRDLGGPAYPTRVDHGCWTSLSGLSLGIAVVAFSAKDSQCSFLHQFAVSLGNKYQKETPFRLSGQTPLKRM